MLQAASIYTKGEGGHWSEDDMAKIMNVLTGNKQ